MDATLYKPFTSSFHKSPPLAFPALPYISPSSDFEMIFAPGGSARPLNRLTYLPAMNADAVSRDRCVCVSVPTHVYLRFQNAFSKTRKCVYSHLHYFMHMLHRIVGKSHCQMAAWINVFARKLTVAQILDMFACWSVSECV